MSMDCAVSVIVPVYNVEKYIRWCLDSLIGQTCSDIEIIVVNDGSTDSSGKIVEEAAGRDARIRVITKPNGGLSSSRNAGIEHSRGRYLAFVDGDDWVEPNFVEDMLQAAQEQQADICICNMKYVNEDGSCRKRTPHIDLPDTADRMKALSDMFNGDKFKFHTPNKLYRRNLFTNSGIRFPEGKLYEDAYTTYQVFAKAERFVYLPEDLYYYRQQRSGSILASTFSKRRYDIYGALMAMEKDVVKGSPELWNPFDHCVVINILSLANYLLPVYRTMDPSDFQEFRDRTNQLERTLLHSNVSSNPMIPRTEKMRYHLLNRNLRLYLGILGKLKK